MKIKMLSTRYGSEDGFKSQPYKRGEEYDVAESLAVSFVNDGYAVRTVEHELRKAN